MTNPGDRPTVSAVIPAYNAERFVGDAIESVLAQTVPVKECIVVDDGSTDGTAEIVRAFDAPVRLLQQENRGVSAARNRGARESRGALLGFLDADDRWFPTRLDQQLDRLQTSPRAEAVVCATEIVDERGVVLGEIRPDPDVTAEALLLCRASVVSVSSNLLIRREAFDAVGGFDESLSTSADWALTYRLVDRGTLETLDEPLVSYRLHGHNMSADVERFQRDMLSAYGAVFETAPNQRNGSVEGPTQTSIA